MAIINAPEMSELKQIRETFIEFFKKNGHTELKSSPLVPHNDPTLMFTNAGMVQFKNVFTGNEQRPAPSVVSSQKCVRAGGKHNDLDNVGYTARHHTFFEMLGNFSFGDYFKEDAIKMAYDLITKDYGIPKDKLYFTTFHTDDEAYNIWKKILGSEDRIIKINTNDNFWSMGNTGPCGPCSEIFYDHGDHIWGGLPGTAEEDGDRFIEIWNLVFMQYDRQEDGEMKSLPKPSIDTGMGLERMAALLQGKHSNYEIDLFEHLIDNIQSNIPNKVETDNSSLRVIADHLRSTSFLIADGVTPSNEGRGYVLRRIMRRAMRHAHQLGCADPLMHKLVNSLTSEMADFFPELNKAKPLIERTLFKEEEAFKRTLERGLKLLDDESNALKSGDSLKGDVAFKLYDTYGFPLDLTQDILRSREVEVDTKGFEESMQEQKERARAAWQGSGSKEEEKIWFELADEFPATEFLGYSTLQAQGQVLKVIDNKYIITNQTPFYARSGGQEGDHGTLAGVSITDTIKKQHFHVHVVKDASEIKEGDNVELKVNSERREKLKCNHSATHLLHKILRDTLGDHIVQKGSLVDADYFRFDFSHDEQLSTSAIKNIEDKVNSAILKNKSALTEISSPDEAVEKGALALFGEKYGDEVRVVSMGDSVELCGGTHIKRTGDIGLFKIIKEGSIASGIRRVECVTGDKAVQYYDTQIITRDTEIDDLKNKIKQLNSDLKNAKKAGAKANEKEEFIGEVTFKYLVQDGVSINDLREVASTYKSNKNTIGAIIACEDNKVGIICTVSDNLTTKFSAVDMVKEASGILGGKGGGGKPNFAQAGGSNFANAEKAINKIKQIINS